jgi:hypothetical protein
MHIIMLTPNNKHVPDREPQIELWMDNWAWAPLPAPDKGTDPKEHDRAEFIAAIKAAYTPEVCDETLQLNAALEAESTSPDA